VSPVNVEEQEKAGGEDGSKDGEAEGVVPGSAEASVFACLKTTINIADTQNRCVSRTNSPKSMRNVDRIFSMRNEEGKSIVNVF